MDIGELRFLVVEDHGFQRWVVGNMLEGLGARYVFSAGDGKAALDLLACREPPIDVVVTDLDMPGMDGMEFIRHIGAAAYPVSLIVASGLDRALIGAVETMARAYAVTMIGSIQKPITPQKLLSAITRHRAASRGDRDVEVPTFTAEEIAEGLARKEFEPFFQPKVEMKTRTLRGAEALARWRHPRHGIVRPQAFIAVMEKAGLIDDLTRVIIERAASNCARWRDERIEARVSINLSPGSLKDVGFADRVIDLIAQRGLDPRHVMFEVTESLAQSAPGPTLENLSRLRMKGFGLSIDDYGTGYSSMERLAQVPFTELKVDRSFVKQASTRPASRAALESSLEMAQKLGIIAVAEGVENRAEWDLVRTLGCHLAQGYLIAQPMDGDEFMIWVRMPEQIRA